MHRLFSAIQAMAENIDHVTIVFNTNAEKKDFMRRCAKPVEEKYLKPSILYDIATGKIKLTGRKE